MYPRLAAVSTLAICLTTSLTATAQIVPDRTLGSESSVVTPNQDIRGIPSDRIDGGAVRGGNLFHSFQEFNIDVGRGAYFSNPDNIINILTRVTGGNISEILGTLGVLGNANFFLINPNGIVFGPNARLDVGGSFFASTADGILFENGVEFAASNPEAPPLLTINMPLGLNIRENPGAIVNQSVAVDSEDNFVGLQVLPRRTLGFIGGDIQVEGGILTAPQGRIELGSVEGNSFVSLTPIETGYTTSYEGVQNFRDIALSQIAFVDVRGEGGGDIQIQGRRVTLTESSIIDARTQGSEPGGLTSIHASESVEVIGSGIFVDLASGATGTGGSITIDTQRLLVQDEVSFISTSTFGNGDGGDLTITATDVELIGSNLFATVQADGTGNAGKLTINTQNLLVRDGAEVSVTTFGNGDAGDLTINTQNLLVQDGAQISTDTLGNGDGGNLTIIANNVELVGTSADGQNPSGLFVGVEAEAVGNGGTLTLNTQNLRVRDDAQISTSTFGNGDGGNLIVTATDVELMGTTSSDDNSTGLTLTANVGPEATGNGGNLTINTQRLLLNNDALVSTDTLGNGDGGNIIINTEYLSVQDDALISTSTFGSGDGGNLIVTATNVELSGSVDDNFGALIAAVGQEATGNGGNITINTQRLLLNNGALISTSTLGNGDAGDLSINTQYLLVRDDSLISAETFGQRDGGQIIIEATDLVEVTDTSSISAVVASGATGDGGDIFINTQRLVVRDGAQISTSTVGNGDGGDLTVTATNIELIAIFADGLLPSGLFAGVRSDATGNGGSLTIDTQNLLVRDGAQIGTGTFGSGSGGDLKVTATDIELVGTGANSQGASSLSASVELGATGNGGTLTIDTERLTVRDGAQIVALTGGSGNGGSLEVRATDIEVIGRSANDQASSGILTSAEAEATGNGGTLTIETQNLSVRDGAQIGAGTFGSGDAGNLTVTAANMEVIGITADGEVSSGLFTSAEPQSTGQAGILTVNADNLTVRDGATLRVRSAGTEAAGNLEINAPTILLDNEASLNAETTAGEGNIILNTSDFRLRNNSRITTNATGVATGGNIEINTNNLIAIEDSDISANAEAAFGGQVIIDANAIFGTQFRQQSTGASDITATSELGAEFSGTVELNSETDPAQGLIELPQTVVDPNDLIAQDPCKLGTESEFFIVGRGGLPPNPTDLQTVNLSRVGLIEPVTPQVNRSIQQPQQRTRNRNNNRENTPLDSRTIVPARGWIRNSEGEIILVGYDPTKTGVQRQLNNLDTCQSSN